MMFSSVFTAQEENRLSGGQMRGAAADLPARDPA
jgi:hypothetical protein